MVSLTDLALKKKTVLIGDDKVEVQGISAEALVLLLDEVPELKLVFAQKELGKDMMLSLFKQSGIVLAHIVAAGIGKPGDQMEIVAARNLPAGTTALLVTGIVDCTFPQGLTNFAEGLAAFMQSAGALAEPIKVQDTKSPAPSSESPEKVVSL